MNYIVEKNFSQTSPFSAICRVIESDGSHLIMAYGYITKSNLTKEIIAKVVDFLAKDPKNRVSIVVGLLPHAGDEESLVNNISDQESVFIHLLPNDLYEKKISDRISVYGVRNFHAKFSLMLNENNRPSAAVTGSSNLTYPALGDTDRFEIDILMTNEFGSNELLESFAAIASKLLVKCIENQDIRLAQRIRNEIHWKPNIKESKKFIENLRAKLYQEYDDIIYYTKSAISKADGIALYESDIELGIRAEDEKDK